MPLPQRCIPLVLVLSGPSGVGKSTVIKGLLLRHPDFALSVSATTRSPRPGEREGVDYHFLSEEGFLADIAAGAFLEHAQVFGRHRYGTPRRPIEGRLAAGLGVVMDIDVQGAAQVRAALPSAVQVFLGPPDRETLERRLTGRGTEAPDAVARRLATAEAELARWRDYDYLVINDSLDGALGALDAIIAAERVSVTRCSPPWREVEGAR